MNEGHIFLKAQLNYSRPLWFELDTGANNALNSSAAKSLGLKLDGESTIEIGGRPQVCEHAHNLTLALGEGRFPGQEFTVCDLSFMEADEGREVDGLIGVDFLRRVVATIDAHWRVLTIFDPGAFQFQAVGQAIPLEQDRRGFFHVEVGVSDAKYSPEVDTGSFFLVLPNTATAFAQGPRLGPAGRLPQVALGSFRLRNPLVYFSQGPWGNGLLGSGLLGTQTLRHFTVTFDFPHARIFLEPSAYFAEADDEHMSGMFLVPQGPDHKVLVVTGLIPGSPAADAGLQIGDSVTSIDGRPASEYTAGALWTMFMHAGRRYTLSVRRGSRLVTIVLITRRLV